jgi:hypothetical protein
VTRDPGLQSTPSELAKEEAKVDRFIRIAGAVVGGGIVAFYLAVRTYEGPSFSTALAIFGVIGTFVGVLSLVFGRRFWEVLLFVFVGRR